MNELKHLKVYQQEHIRSMVNRREGETKLGETVQTIRGKNVFDELSDNDSNFVLLGIPEDIGPRANCGRGGTDDAWKACLQKLLNIQSNQFFNGSELIVLGEVDVDDLLNHAEQIDFETTEGIKKSRDLVKQLDQRVYEVIKTIVAAGKEPVVVGGGHNNSYPILKGAAEGLLENDRTGDKGINCINMDPHADLRNMEGRHSGNGFRYAFNDGVLKKYYILGLHESYNSSEINTFISKNGARIGTTTYESILFGKTDFESALDKAIDFVKDDVIGIELDLDSLVNMPTSAQTPSGFSVEQARRYIYEIASSQEIAYLHISEGAPDLADSGEITVGKTLAYFIADFIKARNEYLRNK